MLFSVLGFLRPLNPIPTLFPSGVTTLQLSPFSLSSLSGNLAIFSGPWRSGHSRMLPNPDSCPVYHPLVCQLRSSHSVPPPTVHSNISKKVAWPTCICTEKYCKRPGRECLSQTKRLTSTIVRTSLSPCVRL